MTFDRVPIRSPLGEFVNLFGGKNAFVSIRVCDDSGELLGAHVLSLPVQWPATVDEVDL